MITKPTSPEGVCAGGALERVGAVVGGRAEGGGVEAGGGTVVEGAVGVKTAGGGTGDEEAGGGTGV